MMVPHQSTRRTAPHDGQELSLSGADSLSPTTSRRSVDEMLDMLCPICEEACSCAGQTELRIKSNSTAISSKRKSIKKGAAPKKARLMTPTPSKPLKSSSVTDGSRFGGKKADLKANPLSRRPSDSPSYSEQRKRNEDLDAQFALSEYYFSDDENTDDMDERSNSENSDEVEAVILDFDDAEDLLAEYYGYSSGSDIAIESLFLEETSYDEGEDEDDNEGSYLGSEGDDEAMLFQSVSFDKTNMIDEQKSSEESLAEQLAKITPQILAAISVATKTLSASQEKKAGATARASMTIPSLARHSYNHQYTIVYGESEGYMTQPQKDTGLRLDDVMDTKKLSKILSTSPPSTHQKSDMVPHRRMLPMDAFRRSRRNSIQFMQPTALTHALRHNSTNCMLTGAPDEPATMYCLNRRQTMPDLPIDQEDGKGSFKEGKLTVEMEFECKVEADDESASAWTECEWTEEYGTLEMSQPWWSLPTLL